MYDFKKTEPEIREFWRKIDLLKKLRQQNKEGSNFFLLDGPPYANDIPHVGHIKNTFCKDFIIRMEFMKGKNVLFQPGFDTHGLPVENKVEKKLKLKSKRDIEKLGVDKFMSTCKKLAATNKDLWMEVYDLLGSWYAWEQPYLTYENYYIESGWWTFKNLWNHGLVYEGKRPVFWCPYCQTALAGYEVTDSYSMVSDPCIFIKFPIKNKKDEYLFVFTTTPWTLLSNVAVAVHPDKEYVKVETAHGMLILAKKRLPLLTELEIGFTIKDEFKGKKLDGLEYEPIIDVPIQRELSKNPKAHRVCMSIPILKERVSGKVASKKEVDVDSKDVFEDFVNVEEGTGLVHTAPGHGKTDHDVGQNYDMPEASPLDDECKFTDDAGQFSGMFVKDADKDIIELLRKTERLVYSTKVEHKYPLCWRCKSPLIFRMSNQWFLKINPIKDRMLEENEKVNWLPGFARERFRNWVGNAEDWNISRQRYWGIPMPIWKCECGHLKIIGSLKELQEHALEEIDDDFDLHTVNNIHLECNKCGKQMKRVNDIFDVWYDSGIAPWASLGYPVKNKELFEKNFPVGRINEAQDQIRGWFYSLMFCGIATFNKAPYQSVSMIGWVVDEKGDKMSKSVGNVVFAKEGIQEIGADNLRYYYFWDIAPYQIQKFNKATAIKEVGKFFNILWNLHLLLNQSVDIEEQLDLKKLEIEDKWILSRLNSVIRDFESNSDNFELHTAGRLLMEFVINDLSRNYVQLVRERLNQDNVPYSVLNHILLSLVRLLAPVTPYISEQIYQNMKNLNLGLKESVHLDSWPKFDKDLIKLDLEQKMEIVQGMLPMILSAREKAKLGIRWPLKDIIVVSDKAEVRRAVEELTSVIKQQTNVKSIIVKESLQVEVKMKPDFAKLGPEYGKLTPQIIARLITESPETILKHINEEGSFNFEIDGNNIGIKKEHFIFTKELPNYIGVDFKDGTVYVSIERTKDLETEGFSREVMRRIQALRKNAGLNKTDKINLLIRTEYLDISLFEDQIKDKVGAKKISITNKKETGYRHSSNETIKGELFEISFDKV